MESFDESVLRMQRIFRGEEIYGEGQPAEQAARFQAEHLFEESVARARAALDQDRIPERIDLLISLVGFSPETTIYAFELLKPRRLLAITSEQAKSSINTIGRYVIHPDRLDYETFSHRRCNPSDPLSIFGIVRDTLKDARTGEGVRPVTVIDITGGKKVMSATAALAAWQLDLNLCYIDSVYDAELRQPVPGSHRLLMLSNPTTLFGDQALSEARRLFDSGAFEAAEERFRDLERRISEPHQARFLLALAGLYRAWCDLDMERLPRMTLQVSGLLQDPRTRLEQRVRASVERQLEFLGRLSNNGRAELLLCYFLLGDHYKELHRKEFAVMLYYRTIEGCFTEHLARQYSVSSLRAPDYSALGVDRQELESRFNESLQLVFSTEAKPGLPSWLGFITSAVLLHALGDAFFKATNYSSERGLKALRRLGEYRNESVLAHGFRSVTDDEVQQLCSAARQTLKAFWSIHHPNDDVEGLLEALAFVRLGD